MTQQSDEELLFAVNQVSKYVQSDDGDNAMMVLFSVFMGACFGLPCPLLINALGEMELVKTETRSLN
ncbi:MULTISPECIES: hypothetical protein [unclassified Methylobacter]|jgi:hypothetical protein|uniref:hypothetical protein n=1 Tax=unclassified Methylobacter TaxID=2635283 RepID=UPI001892F06A|nr:hypothetical protein [Methylobacter sp. BlB1]MBF6650564.1 hypothetical protein [Methylobacter sp. BlB1]